MKQEKTLSEKIRSGYDCECGENLSVKDVKQWIKEILREILKLKRYKFKLENNELIDIIKEGIKHTSGFKDLE